MFTKAADYSRARADHYLEQDDAEGAFLLRQDDQQAHRSQQAGPHRGEEWWVLVNWGGRRVSGRELVAAWPRTYGRVTGAGEGCAVGGTKRRPYGSTAKTRQMVLAALGVVKVATAEQIRQLMCSGTASAQTVRNGCLELLEATHPYWATIPGRAPAARMALKQYTWEPGPADARR
ncbi:hypothetical protein [Streptomyces kronopolitis]|uniref:hypothetical protein n=1 Tax=Streptomyces kronopolitis TaxID=1612435 RepID=UPI0036813AB4